MEEWMAAKRVEPWGDDWEQAAMIGSIASMAGHFKKVIPASDLIPRVARKDPAMTDAQVGGALMSMIQQVGQFGGGT